MAGFTAYATAGLTPWVGADNGMLGAVSDPALISGQVILVAGTLYLVKLPIRTQQTITNLLYGLQGAGVGASTGTFAGLYSSSGVLLSGSADIGVPLTGGAGQITVPLTTPQVVFPATPPWAAIVVNLATTQPTLYRNGTTGVAPNFNLTAANDRTAVNGTLLLSLPASITPSANASTGGVNPWVGWS